jgi:predicted ATP-grasp superfamily ATP-dependent carboligase
MKIYLSSTYLDLVRHRAKVANSLRKAGYEVVMMEEYAARDQRVEFACMGDVNACDVYVGIFA